MLQRRRSKLLIFVAQVTALLAGLALALPGAALAGDGWPWPVDGDVITTYKNGDDPYASGQHRGIDIAAPVGTPVRAPTAGSITFAGRLPDGGLAVTMRSSDDRYLLGHLHLSEINVARGDHVTAGGLLGKVGSTGARTVNAAHLHFSTRLANNGAYVDPLPLLAKPGRRPAPVDAGERVARPIAAEPPAVAETPVAQVRSPRTQTGVVLRGRFVERAARGSLPHAHGLRDRRTSRFDRSSRAVSGHDSSATGSMYGESRRRTSHAPGRRVAPPPLGALPRQVRLVAPAAAVPATRKPVAIPTASSVRGIGWPRWPLLLIATACVAILVARFRRPAGATTGPAGSGEAAVTPGSGSLESSGAAAVNGIGHVEPAGGDMPTIRLVH